MRADSYYPGMKGQSGKWYPDDLVIAPPTAGKYLFVDGNVSGSGAGNSWEDCYKIVEAATTAGSRGDQIMIAPKATDGYYDENVRIGDGTSATEYAKCGMHVMGVTNGLKNVRIKAVASSDELHPFGSLSGVSMLGAALFVMCSSIEISNLCFDAEGVYTGVYWGDGYRPFSFTGQSDAQNGSIHDCTFKMGTTGLYYDGCSNDQHCYGNMFYKQTDESIYIGPGGLQQSSRVRIHDNFFIGPEDYGVRAYSSAAIKNCTVGPNNVFQDQASATEMTNPVYFTNGTPTNAVVGNYFACETDNNAGTNDQSCGNYDGTTGNTVVHVRES